MGQGSRVPESQWLIESAQSRATTAGGSLMPRVPKRSPQQNPALIVGSHSGCSASCGAGNDAIWNASAAAAPLHPSALRRAKGIAGREIDHGNARDGHSRGVQRSEPAEARPRQIEVERGEGKLPGDRVAYQEASNPPDQRGDGGNLDRTRPCTRYWAPARWSRRKDSRRKSPLVLPRRGR
jgi:hypothetical protein